MDRAAGVGGVPGEERALRAEIGPGADRTARRPGAREAEPRAGQHDPFGAPVYPVFTQRYNEHVTSDIRARERNIEGFDDYAQIVNVAARLQERGFTESDVRKILGENFLRVFGEVFG